MRTPTLIVALGLAAPACNPEPTPKEEAKEMVDAVQEGEDVESVGEAAGDVVEAVGDEAGEAVEETVEEAEEKAEGDK